MDIVSLQQKLNATQIYLSKASTSDGVDQDLLNRINTLESLVNDIQENIIPALDTSLTNNYSTLADRVQTLENQTP